MNTKFQSSIYDVPSESGSETTYDAPLVSSSKELHPLYAGYEQALRGQNRTTLVFYSDLPLSHSLQDITGTAGWYIPNFYPDISDFLFRSTQKRKGISLAQARDIAVGILLEAENRRQNERKREAKFWENLDSEE